MTVSRRLPPALAVVLLAAPAWPQPRFRAEEAAAARNDPKRFTIDEATIRIARIGPAADPASIKSPDGDSGEALPTLDEIINIGSKFWKIIADNEPAVDVKTSYATALPKGSTGWTQLGGWQPPAGEIYELTASNGYGLRMINVRYQVLRTYGGSYEGTGRYLTAVAVEPLLVETGWAYRFSMEASVPDTSVVNVGTSSSPVAGMMAALSWRISTPIKDSRGQGLYFLQGDGVFKEIGGPFSGPELEKARQSAAASGGTSPRFE